MRCNPRLLSRRSVSLHADRNHGDGSTPTELPDAAWEAGDGNLERLLVSARTVQRSAARCGAAAACAGGAGGEDAASRGLRPAAGLAGHAVDRLGLAPASAVRRA